MDDFNWSLWIPIVATVIIGIIGLIMQRRQIALAEAQLLAASKKKLAPNISAWKKYWPLVVMIVCTGVSWLPYMLADNDSSRIPTHYMVRWGEPSSLPLTISIDDPNLGGQVVADGRLLQKYATKFKLAAVAFHNFPPTDPYDARNLQKSPLRDVGNNDVDIRIPFDATFRQELKTGVRNTSYVLLLVPNGIKMSGFDTVHEAMNAGIKVLGQGGGPP